MSNSTPKLLFIEACNFVDSPVGGQLSFARQMLACWGADAAYAGWTNDLQEPVGRWFKKRLGDVEVDYFAFHRHQPGRAPHRFLPARMVTFMEVRRWQRRLLEGCHAKLVLTCEPSVLIPLRLHDGQRLAYYFPGVASPLSVSRFPFLRPLAGAFEKLIFRALRKADLLLAAADAEAIISLKQRAGSWLAGREVHFFPTRVDTARFTPSVDRAAIRARLQVPDGVLLLVTTGRVHEAKGFDLLLKAFARFRGAHAHARLVFVGDGPQRQELLGLAASLGIAEAVAVTGFVEQAEVAVWLQAADLLVMGSITEGWCTSLVEALACGLPIVTTRFSSADTLVREGINGFVVQRDPVVFADAMEKALHLPAVRTYSQNAIHPYALSRLRYDLTSALAL
jgi:glycosyltransferase involved in cell wall biosynthesis